MKKIQFCFSIIATILTKPSPLGYFLIIRTKDRFNITWRYFYENLGNKILELLENDAEEREIEKRKTVNIEDTKNTFSRN